MRESRRVVPRGCLWLALLACIQVLDELQVVDHERPDLQEQARSLVRSLGEYTITLKELEDNLLQRLANSQVGCCSGLAGDLPPCMQPMIKAWTAFDGTATSRLVGEV